MSAKARSSTIGILAFLVASLLFLVIHSARRPKPGVLLGYIPFSADLPFFVALEKGFFKDQGIEPMPVRFSVSSECLNAVVSGKVSGAMGNSLSALIAIEAEAPGSLKMFLPMLETEKNYVSHVLVRNDSEIKTLAGLRGNSIGTYTGSTQLLYLKLFLKEVGLEPEKDVQVVQVDANLQAQALAAGQFDALFTIDPYATLAIQKTGARSLAQVTLLRKSFKNFRSRTGVIRAGVEYARRQGDVVKTYRLALR